MEHFKPSERRGDCAVLSRQSLLYFQPLILAYVTGTETFPTTDCQIGQGSCPYYGGGIGDLSHALAQAGLKVTYVDIRGRTFDFAKWFLERNGYKSIVMLDAVQDQERIWADKYDTVICIDVIEDVPRPDRLLGKIAASLKDNGALVITGLNSKTDNKEHPMHLPVPFDPETLLNSLGLYQSKSHDLLWIKKSLKSK